MAARFAKVVAEQKMALEMLAAKAAKAPVTIGAGLGSSATLGRPPPSKGVDPSASLLSSKKKCVVRKEILPGDRKDSLDEDEEAELIFGKQEPDGIADTLGSSLLTVNTGITALVKEVKSRDKWLQEAREETFKVKSALTDAQKIITETAEALDEANERARAAEKWVYEQEERLVKFQKIIRQACEQIEKKTPCVPAFPIVRDRKLLTLSDRRSREDARYIMSVLRAMQAKILKASDDQDECIADGLELAYKRIRVAMEDSGVKDFPDPSLIFKYQKGEEKFECKLQRDAFRRELAEVREYLAAKAHGEVSTIAKSSNLLPRPPSEPVALPLISKENQPKKEIPEEEKEGDGETAAGEEAVVAKETIEAKTAAGGNV